MDVQNVQVCHNGAIHDFTIGKWGMGDVLFWLEWGAWRFGEPKRCRSLMEWWDLSGGWLGNCDTVGGKWREWN